MGSLLSNIGGAMSDGFQTGMTGAGNAITNGIESGINGLSGIGKLFSNDQKSGTDIGNAMPWLNNSGTDLGNSMPWLNNKQDNVGSNPNAQQTMSPNSGFLGVLLSNMNKSSQNPGQNSMMSQIQSAFNGGQNQDQIIQQLMALLKNNQSSGTNIGSAIMPWLNNSGPDIGNSMPWLKNSK
jgi:hypothetical protein